MEITPFQPEHMGRLVQSWNDWLPPSFRVDERLLAQVTLDHPSWKAECSQLLWEGEELAGFMLAREDRGEVVIDALAVRPDRRRRGLASDLIQTFPSCRLGGGPSHFVPGLPKGWAESEAFFLSRGFRQDWVALDLKGVPAFNERSYTSATTEDRDEVLRMVERDFSARWTHDTLRRFDAGDASDVILHRERGEVVAFCHTWHFQSELLGPSVFWLRNTCATFGGIGPVGVSEKARGLGLGRVIVEAALTYLKGRGATEVGVDWTSIGPFYHKFGFKDWRRYVGLKRNGVAR